MIKVGTGRPGQGQTDQNSHYKAGIVAIQAGHQSLVPDRTEFSMYISARKLTLAKFLIFSQ